MRWLRDEPQLAARVGGDHFLRTRVQAPVDLLEDGFDFDYFNGLLRFSSPFLHDWARLRADIGDAAWAEALRLFFLHEGHHIDQGMVYGSRGVGRAGHVLEAVDYDADVVAFEACVAWRARHERQPRAPMQAFVDILDNALRCMTLFEGRVPSQPLVFLKERRLRRYLIWHLQRARAVAAGAKVPLERLALRERVWIELAGLPVRQQPHDGRAVDVVDLAGLACARPVDPELMFYVGGRLYRCAERELCGELIHALCLGVPDRVSRVLHILCERYPPLVPT